MASGEIMTLACELAVTAANNRDFDALRRGLGDCTVGAYAAGAEMELAMQIAGELHRDPRQQSRIAELGGLTVGAEAYFLRGKL